MPYALANASASSNAQWTGATWTGQCCFVSIYDIIIYSRNAVEQIYHLRLVLEGLSEAGMKIKPDDGKQNSMTNSSESEDSEHSLAGGVIQYIYYIFGRAYTCVLASRGGGLYTTYTSWILFYFISLFYIFYCNFWIFFRAMHSSTVIITVAFIPPCKGIKFCFAEKNGFSIQICRPSWILGSEMCFNTKLTSDMDSFRSN